MTRGSAPRSLRILFYFPMSGPPSGLHFFFLMSQFGGAARRVCAATKEEEPGSLCSRRPSRRHCGSRNTRFNHGSAAQIWRGAQRRVLRACEHANGAARSHSCTDRKCRSVLSKWWFIFRRQPNASRVRGAPTYVCCAGRNYLVCVHVRVSVCVFVCV